MARLRFDFEWRLTLFVAVLLPFLISLGFWQLGRAEEKRTLSATALARDASDSLSAEQLEALDPGDLSGRKVRLQGRFLNHQYLLDNQIKQGRFGNDVIQLFQGDQGRLYFVNRGWVPADPARQSPTVVPSGGEVSFIEGRVYIPPSQPYLLAPDALKTGGSPWTIQAVDLPTLRQTLGERQDAAYPYLIRLVSEDMSAFDASWPVVNISDAKHTGYAIQWFCMAAVLALLFIHRSTNAWALISGRTEG